MKKLNVAVVLAVVVAVIVALVVFLTAGFKTTNSVKVVDASFNAAQPFNINCVEEEFPSGVQYRAVISQGDHRYEYVGVAQGDSVSFSGGRFEQGWISVGVIADEEAANLFLSECAKVEFSIAIPAT